MAFEEQAGPMGSFRNAYELGRSIQSNSTTTVGQVAAGSNPPTAKSATSSLDQDPLGYRTLSYPEDITHNMENGHYMLFYVNVQNKTKYAYRDAAGVPIGNTYEVATDHYRSIPQGPAGTGGTVQKLIKTTYVTEKGAGADEISYLKGRITGVE